MKISKNGVRLKFMLMNDDGDAIEPPGPCRLRGKLPNGVNYLARTAEGMLVEFLSYDLMLAESDNVQELLLTAAREKYTGV